MDIEKLEEQLNLTMKAAENIDDTTGEMKELLDNSDTDIDIETEIGTINHLSFAIQEEVRKIRSKFSYSIELEFANEVGSAAYELIENTSIQITKSDRSHPRSIYHKFECTNRIELESMILEYCKDTDQTHKIFRQLISKIKEPCNESTTDKSM